MLKKDLPFTGLLLKGKNNEAWQGWSQGFLPGCHMMAAPQDTRAILLLPFAGTLVGSWIKSRPELEPQLPHGTPTSQVVV